MKYFWTLGLLAAPFIAQGQLTKKMTYDRPKVTEKELWELEYETRPDELALKAAKEDQETVVHRQTRSVARSETTVERSRSAALDYKLLGAPGHRPNLDDRLAASMDQERVYPRMDADVAILELIYRRMLEYRQLGFATDVKVFFLGTGITGDDPPEVVVDRLQKASELGDAGLTMLPVSRSINIPRDAIRDRRTLEEGVVFRVNSIFERPDGTYRVVASFSQRDSFYFTKEFEVARSGDDEFEIVGERDYVASIR